MSKLAGVSIVIPAYNEQAAISATIDTVRKVFESHGVKTEVIVVDDGSSDATADIAAGCGATVVRHPENLGYGAALKSGIRCAAHEWIAITDADGTYPADEFPRLLEYVPTFDMVVGARTGKHYHGGLTKRMARFLFRWFSEFVTGRVIPDINSGMRIFRRDFVVSEWEYISSGFSFTTTLTLSMMLSSMFVKYVPIRYNVRVGKSHVRYWRDTLRSAQLIIQVGVWYNPIKIALLLCLSASAVSLIAGAVVCSLPWLAAPAIILWVGFLCCLLLFALGAHAYICRHIPTAMGSRTINARNRELDKRNAATNSSSLAPEPEKELNGKEEFPER